jgi:hypothetical protein
LAGSHFWVASANWFYFWHFHPNSAVWAKILCQSVLNGDHGFPSYLINGRTTNIKYKQNGLFCFVLWGMVSNEL